MALPRVHNSLYQLSTGRTQESTQTMPKTVTQNATKKSQPRSKKPKPKLTPYPVVALTDEMRTRFAELAHRGVIDDVCPACQSAVGLPKMLRDGKTQYICAPCHLTLYYHKWTPCLLEWRTRRLPVYRLNIAHPEEAADLLMRLARQENYRKPKGE